MAGTTLAASTANLTTAPAYDTGRTLRRAALGARLVTRLVAQAATRRCQHRPFRSPAAATGASATQPGL